jgi:hypothetical protein
MDDDFPNLGVVESVVVMHDHIPEVRDGPRFLDARFGFRKVMQCAAHHFANDSELSLNGTTEHYITSVIAELLTGGEKSKFFQALLDVYEVDGKITLHTSSLVLPR